MPADNTLASLLTINAFTAARDTLRGQAGPGGQPDDGPIGRALAMAIERYGAASIYGRLPEALASSLLVPRGMA